MPLIAQADRQQPLKAPAAASLGRRQFMAGVAGLGATFALGVRAEAATPVQYGRGYQAGGF